MHCKFADSVAAVGRFNLRDTIPHVPRRDQLRSLKLLETVSVLDYIKIFNTSWFGHATKLLQDSV